MCSILTPVHSSWYPPILLQRSAKKAQRFHVHCDSSGQKGENRSDKCKTQRIPTIIGIEAYKAMGFHSSYSKTSKRRRINESGCTVSGTDLGYTACMDLWMLCPSTKRCPHVEASHRHCLFLKLFKVRWLKWWPLCRVKPIHLQK